MGSSSLITTFYRWENTINKWLAFILIFSLAYYSFTDNKNYQQAIIFFIITLSIRVLFDIHKNVSKKIKDETCFTTYEGFQSLSGDLKGDIVSLLNKSKPVDVKIMGVSAHYSWPYIEENILLNCHDNLCKNSSIKIQVAIADKDYLKTMKVHKWRDNSENITKRINFFKEKHEYLINEGLVSIDLYHYTNIPHWHGILVNDTYLYLGNADWVMNKERGIFDLTVGTNEYRKFKKTNKLGRSKIDMFNHWFDYYKIISLKKSPT